MKGWFKIKKLNWGRAWLVLIVCIIAWFGSCTTGGRQVNVTGSGTLADPFVIWDVDDLQDIALDLTAYYELGQNIDASPTISWNPPNDRGAWAAFTAYAVNDYVKVYGYYRVCIIAHISGASIDFAYWDEATAAPPAGHLGFAPIGKKVLPYFTGSFDGKGHEISDLFIARAGYCMALFGRTNGANIADLKIANCNITSSPPINIMHVAALIGRAAGTVVSNCHSSGTVTAIAKEACYNIAGLVGLLDNNSSMDDCSSSVNVTSGEKKVWATGGLVAYVNGGSRVNRSHATGNVITSGTDYSYHAGGLVGRLDGSMSDSYAMGSVSGDRGAGGAVGCVYAGRLLDNSYSAGAVSGSINVGGLCGVNAGTVRNSFWDIETSGQTTSAGGEGKTTEEMKTLATFKDAGWDIEPTTEADLNDGYPFLSWQLGSSPIWLIFKFKEYSLVQQEILELLRR